MLVMLVMLVMLMVILMVILIVMVILISVGGRRWKVRCGRRTAFSCARAYYTTPLLQTSLAT